MHGLVRRRRTKGALKSRGRGKGRTVQVLGWEKKEQCRALRVAENEARLEISQPKESTKKRGLEGEEGGIGKKGDQHSLGKTARSDARRKRALRRRSNNRVTSMWRDQGFIFSQKTKRVSKIYIQRKEEVSPE